MSTEESQMTFHHLRLTMKLRHFCLPATDQKQRSTNEAHFQLRQPRWKTSRHFHQNIFAISFVSLQAELSETSKLSFGTKMKSPRSIGSINQFGHSAKTVVTTARTVQKTLSQKKKKKAEGWRGGPNSLSRRSLGTIFSERKWCLVWKAKLGNRWTMEGRTGVTTEGAGGTTVPPERPQLYFFFFFFFAHYKPWHTGSEFAKWMNSRTSDQSQHMLACWHHRMKSFLAATPPLLFVMTERFMINEKEEIYALYIQYTFPSLKVDVYHS